ncbi:MAG: methyltransferase domain-containing protein [Acidobacteria bacterium]|nr:methyltransferase domain-containing protein [Acidobacteriota bacterium]
MGSKEYFDDVAKQWDRVRETFYSQTVREKSLVVADVQPGRVAADIGAGTGFITEGLLQKGLKVIAVDQSEAMLAEMKRKLAHFDGIEYRVGQAESLPVPGETMDYVFANMYLHHVESPPEAIREMTRILKPGGKLVLTDLDEHTFEFLKVEHRDRWMGFKREDVQRWFVKAGLYHVGTDDANASCCVQSATVSIFVAFGEKVLADRVSQGVLEPGRDDDSEGKSSG